MCAAVDGQLPQVSDDSLMEEVLLPKKKQIAKKIKQPVAKGKGKQQPAAGKKKATTTAKARSSKPTPPQHSIASVSSTPVADSMPETAASSNIDSTPTSAALAPVAKATPKSAVLPAAMPSKIAPRHLKAAPRPAANASKKPFTKVSNRSLSLFPTVFV